MLTAKQRMVRGYGFAIYEDGTRSFATVGDSYHEDIKAYAAGNFPMEKLDAALAAQRITQAEYDETLALIGTIDAEVWSGI
ncbi:hypothetical protein [Paenibacillus cookii]|uniref:Bypass of forespore C C-terminal domain-containing protein n=1 Tax=Paenibacillus cookii TaxID=157839 RepID=A0ABQ4LX70_9BACL|nr:hypothetical protein [Paenibacillus cookii]KHF35872.1 hypothetical protein CM49_01810 [Paenibacillus sp. P1XP2]GIO67847.1 hypothetical protein J21TS3_26680 [Paenibacillus cookii]